MLRRQKVGAAPKRSFDGPGVDIPAPMPQGRPTADLAFGSAARQSTIAATETKFYDVAHD